jgi:hypothetical protein
MEFDQKIFAIISTKTAVSPSNLQAGSLAFPVSVFGRDCGTSKQYKSRSGLLQ